MPFVPLPLSELAAAFRQRGEVVAPYAPEVAKAFEHCAEWLQLSLGASLEKPLTLGQAARETGWSYEGLRRRLKDDELNVGEEGAPLVRRGDLARLGAPRGPRGKYRPRKPKSAPVTDSTPDATSLVEAEGGSETPDMASAAEPSAQAGVTPDAPDAVEVVTSDVDSPRSDADAVVQTSDASVTTPRRSRQMHRGVRGQSSKERFNTIRALAARG